MKNSTAIFILSGSLFREQDGRWRTTMWSDDGKSNFLVLGDRLRVVAGALLYEHHEGDVIIASGGVGLLADAGVPPVADVLKKELIELGVPNDVILTDRESGKTWSQLQVLKRLMHSHGFKRCMIVSNDYHLPRIAAMIEYDKELRQFFHAGVITLRSAEDILFQYQPDQWRDIIYTAKESALMKQLAASEARGVEQIQNGSYKFD